MRNDARTNAPRGQAVGDGQLDLGFAGGIRAHAGRPKRGDAEIAAGLGCRFATP